MHADEVRLLALLHDAGLPVLGKSAVGQVVSRDSSGKWQWEFDEVLGDLCDSESMALAQLHRLRFHLFSSHLEEDSRSTRLRSLKEIVRVEIAEREAMRGPAFASVTAPLESLLSKPVLPSFPAQNPFPGFRNCGNTCYANAMLHRLFHCDCVRAQWGPVPDGGCAMRAALVSLLEEYTSHRTDAILPHAFLTSL